jgi:hypothetical protein
VPRLASFFHTGIPLPLQHNQRKAVNEVRSKWKMLVDPMTIGLLALICAFVTAAAIGIMQVDHLWGMVVSSADVAATEISQKKTQRDPVKAAGGWLDTEGRRVNYSSCSEVMEGRSWVFVCTCRDYQVRHGLFNWADAGKACGFADKIPVPTPAKP